MASPTNRPNISTTTLKVELQTNSLTLFPIRMPSESPLGSPSAGLTLTPLTERLTFPLTTAALKMNPIVAPSAILVSIYFVLENLNEGGIVSLLQSQLVIMAGGIQGMIPGSGLQWRGGCRAGQSLPMHFLSSKTKQ